MRKFLRSILKHHKAKNLKVKDSNIIVIDDHEEWLRLLDEGLL